MTISMSTCYPDHYVVERDGRLGLVPQAPVRDVTHEEPVRDVTDEVASMAEKGVRLFGVADRSLAERLCGIA